MSDVNELNYEAGPLLNVWLRTGFAVSEGTWGRVIRYSDLPGLAASILDAVVKKSGRLCSEEILYLRRKLDLSQAECANLIGVEEQTLSLWERGKYPMPIPTDVILRRVCIEELAKFFPKKARFPSAALLLRSASRICDGRYVCEFENGQWNSTFESVESLKEIPLAMAISPSVTWLTNGIHVALFNAEKTFVDFGGEVDVQSRNFLLEAKRVGVPEASGVEMLRGKSAGMVIVGMNNLVETATSGDHIVKFLLDQNMCGVNLETDVWFPTSASSSSKEIVYGH